MVYPCAIIVKFNALSVQDVNIAVQEIRGCVIFNHYNISAFNETINLSHVQSGLYLVKVRDGINQASKKTNY